MAEGHSAPQELPMVPSKADKPATRASSVRLHSSPDFLTTLLAPPGAVIGVNFTDQRFTSMSKLDASKLSPPYTQRTYSMVWNDNLRTWQEAILGVHRYQWTKWSKLREQAPLIKGQKEQEPGVIDQSIMEEVDHFIATNFGKKRPAPSGPDTTSGKAKKRWTCTQLHLSHTVHFVYHTCKRVFCCTLASVCAAFCELVIVLLQLVIFELQAGVMSQLKFGHWLLVGGSYTCSMSPRLLQFWFSWLMSRGIGRNGGGNLWGFGFNLVLGLFC